MLNNSSTTRTIISLCLLLLIPSIKGERGKNPCHPNRNVATLGVNCEHIRFPPRMCRACKISSYGSDGLFNDCSAIYDITEPSCKAQLEYYSRLNPCDTVRADQIADLSNEDNRKSVDYFVYSICEQCCDCIPKGAKWDQYKERKKNRTLLSFIRGNCPAHAHYDVCRVWPHIRHLTGPNGKPKVNKFPKVCPLILNWFNSPEFEGWHSRDVVIENDIVRFLKNFNRHVKCRNREIWQECVGLEKSQKRI